MDLVDYDQGVFERISESFAAFAAKLEIGDLSFIPISALHGDNVVQRSDKMPWQRRAVAAAPPDTVTCLGPQPHRRSLPVQYVIRAAQATDPNRTTTGLCGPGRGRGYSSPETRSCTCRPG